MTRPAINWLPLSILLAVAALTFWWQRTSEESDEAPVATAGGIDYWARNFTIHRFGPDGKLQNVLRAERLAHDSSDDSSELIAPRIDYARTPPLVVRAERGVVAGKGDVIVLIGKVQLDQMGDTRAGKAPLQVRTERMKITPERQIAEGRSSVRLEQRRSIVTAERYRVDGKSGTSVLEGRVRATIHRKES